MKDNHELKGRVFRPLQEVPPSEYPFSTSLNYSSADGVKEDLGKGNFDDMLSNIRLRDLTLYIEKETES